MKNHDKATIIFYRSCKVNKCENADVLISDFKSQLANQAATRATREYAIPVPEEHVKFSFIEYVSALHLTSDDKKSIIGNLREQLRSTGYIYEERLIVLCNFYSYFLNALIAISAITDGPLFN